MNYLEEFLEFLEYQRSLSLNTIKSYRWDLLGYSKWLGERGLESNEVKVRDIDTFIISLRKSGNSASTINRKISGLKTFYRWLQRIEVIKNNPWESIQCLKQTRSLPRYLTLEQQEALIQASQNGNQKNDWLRRRSYLAILLFLDTGLRVSELCNIQMENIDLCSGIIKIIGKGKKERQIILSDRCIKALQEYIQLIQDTKIFNEGVGPGLASRGVNLNEVAKECGMGYFSARQAFINHSDKTKELKSYIENKIKPKSIKYLFFNTHGKIWNSRHCFRIIQILGKEIGIDGFYPHMLRHTYATNLRRKGADLLLIKEALGHSSVSTTEIYAHIGNEEYKKQIRSLIN